MEKFFFFLGTSTDPYFNLATEEYFLKHKDGCYITVWRNSPAVIIGAFQNAFSEVNLGECERKNVKIVRRLTGGGAVYHDENNLCFTVISKKTDGENTFLKFSRPVVEYLKSLGLPAEFSGRNDILIDGKKISGNAETFYKDKVMHHGTILFKTDMETLSAVLKPNRFKTESKGIKSVRSRVANVSDFTDIGFSEFTEGLVDKLKENAAPYTLTKEDVDGINALVLSKYSTYEWNMAESFKGKNSFAERFSFGTFEFYFDLKNGRIVNPKIIGDFFALRDVSEFTEKLNGVKFERKSLLSAFSDIGEYILYGNGEEIVSKLFS